MKISVSFSKFLLSIWNTNSQYICCHLFSILSKKKKKKSFECGKVALSLQWYEVCPFDIVFHDITSLFDPHPTWTSLSSKNPLRLQFSFLTFKLSYACCYLFLPLLVPISLVFNLFWFAAFCWLSSHWAPIPKFLFPIVNNRTVNPDSCICMKTNVS